MKLGYASWKKVESDGCESGRSYPFPTEEELAMRPETGWLVFFFPKRGQVVSWLIAFGEMLGRIIKTRIVHRKIPHHVEIMQRKIEGVYLYGADAHSGFIGKPAARRLDGLKQGRDYLIVAIHTENLRRMIAECIKEIDGTPYENWEDVIKVWRDGNNTVGDEKLFCSEACVRIYQYANQRWSMDLDANNTSPLDLMIEVLKLPNSERVATVDWDA